jgi:hypothetical protein
MSENLAHDEQAIAAGDCDRCEGMPQIVQSQVRQTGKAPDSLPRLLHPYEVRTRPIARKHMRVAYHSRQRIKNRQRTGRQV